MKYKPARDLFQFAQEYSTLSPTKLANIVLAKRNKKVTSQSVTMWFKRHPEVYDQLAKWMNEQSKKGGHVPMFKPEVLAELDTSDYGSIKIVNSETLDIARRLLSLIEAKLKAQRASI